jgi:hypothetical protein
MAAAGYAKAFIPLTKVKVNEFLSRPMGRESVAFTYRATSTRDWHQHAI